MIIVIFHICLASIEPRCEEHEIFVQGSVADCEAVAPGAIEAWLVANRPDGWFLRMVSCGKIQGGEEA